MATLRFATNQEDDPNDELPPRQATKPNSSNNNRQQRLKCLTCHNVFVGRVNRKYCDLHSDNGNRQKEFRLRQKAVSDVTDSNSNAIPLQVSNSVTTTLVPLPDSELPIKHNGRLVTSVTLAKED